MNSVTRNYFNYWVALSVVSVLHCLMSVEESGLQVMLLEDWPKYGRTRQSVKQPKSKVYETMVLSILCYNSETGILTAETNRQLRVFEMGCLRRIMDVTRRDHIKNVDIRTSWHYKEDIVERIQARKLRYFGHVVRMDQHRLPNIAL